MRDTAGEYKRYKADRLGISVDKADLPFFCGRSASKEEKSMEIKDFTYLLLATLANKSQIINLRDRANNTDIIFNLMPEEFTIGELKQVYEIILGKKLINSAFRRVIAKKIESAPGQIKTGGHRPSNLFRYKKD